MVVAVSGGADSTCLLDVVVTALGEAAPRVIVGHVDHQLRPESGEDAEHVRQLAASYGVRCEVATVAVPALAQTERVGLEEAARIGRYRALSQTAAEGKMGHLLTGHTRSDNVETVLMHLLRGTGQRGLAGIAPAEYLDPHLVAADNAVAGSRFASLDSRRLAVKVIRPLLDVDRAETTAYCVARGLRWRDDPSNADRAFTRNRIRQHLLPVLRTYNPNIETALARLAQTSRDEEHWLHRMVAQGIEGRGISEHTDEGVTFDLAGWSTMPVALRRRIVRRVASECDVRDLGFEAVELALSVAGDHGPPRVQLPGGLVVSRAGGRLLFQRTSPKTDATS